MNHTFLGFYIYKVMSHATVINSLSETSRNLDGFVYFFFLADRIRQDWLNKI